jgi:uncharacterized protein YndB with AHSA1/START domain
MNTDRIEKKILLSASRKRVWGAVSDSTQFGTWFDVKFNGPFVPEAKVRGVIVPPRVNAEVAKAQQDYDGLAFEITIEQMEPERLFSFCWHPNAVQRDVDYTAEPTTLVVFAEDMGNGVMLSVTESGFDQVPLARRATALTANEQDWGAAVELIEEYVGDPRLENHARAEEVPTEVFHAAAAQLFPNKAIPARIEVLYPT